jgi:hypothetical protein
LVGDGSVTDSLRARYACRCGAPRCRGMMIDDRATR